MDAVGNVFRTACQRDRRYGAGGRLEEADGFRYEYDADGNQTAKIHPDDATWRYAWDGHGMLREVERPDGSKVAFEYDAFARRTKKRLLSAAGEVLRETRYVWDGDVIVHELGSDEDELTTWRFEPETFTPIAKERGERRWAIASDHLGTPTEMVDELGKLAWKMQLDVLGVPAFEEGDAEHCPFRWPGQYEDEETGLYYNRFRYYDPEQGGYTADDPIGLEGGIRLRGYVEDPWTWVDPWGLSKEGCGANSRYKISPRAARRKAMREAGVPVSQQPIGQISVRAPGNRPAGRQYTYEISTKGGGTQRVSVQHSLTDRVDGHGPHWEAGPIKPGGQVDSIGRPRLTSDKIKINEQ